MIVVAGASGFIGRALCEAIVRRGGRVVRIGRGAEAEIAWPVRGMEFDDGAMRTLARAAAVVALSGEPIATRWDAARKQEIHWSRAGLTGVLARAIGRAGGAPPAVISASAVGFYGDRGDEWLDESSMPGSDFLASVVRDWEAAAGPAAEAGARVVHARMGAVLGAGGGMLARVVRPFRLGGGATLGRGRQWMSWISLGDAVEALLRAIDDDALHGPVNVVSPEPARNATFTAALARAVRRPALLFAPAPVLRLAFGEMADALLLASQRVRPGALQAAGFAFGHATLDAALAAALTP
ncbi:MAG: TIGR01777 family oxidoreductase [Gemmatimonadaceae bacterium]|nr:TIGR01777 family oxidoreductase [Gemmatimonadaceae bacterium]